MAERVRLVDIARAANVTTTAASLALNGRPGVSEPTRRRVQRLAREMGYAPHQGARALARGRSGLWGAWVSGPEELWSRWLSGVLTQASSSILVARIPSSERRRDMARQAATEGRLDGCLVFDPDGDDAGLQPLLEHRVPVVIAGRRSNWFDSIEIHEQPAFDRLADQADRRGRPAALVATRIQLQRDDARVRAWQNPASPGAAERIVLPVADDTSDQGAFAANELLERHPGIGSVIAIAGDRVAIGALRAFASRGIASPDAIAVAGWGDQPPSAWIEPALTSVAIPWEEAGIRSVLSLSRRFGRPDLPRSHRALDARIVARRSF